MIVLISLPSWGRSFVVDSYFDGLKIYKDGPYIIETKNSKVTKIIRDKLKPRTGLFLLPGLVDAHVHLYYQEYLPYGNHKESLAKTFSISDSQRKILIESFLNDRIKKGFIWLRDLGGDRRGRKVLKSLIKEKGSNYPFVEMMGESLTWGPGQCSPPLNCDRISIDLKNYKIDQLDKLLKGLVQKGLSHLKVYLDSDPFDSQPMPIPWVKAIIQKAKDLKLKVAFHVGLFYPLEKIISSMDENFSLEHIYHVSNDFPLEKARAVLVPTDIPFSFIEFIKNRGGNYQAYYFDKIKSQKRFKKLLERNLPLCFGSDFYFETSDSVKTRSYWAIESLVDWHELGMSNLDVLKSATSNCSKLFNKKPFLIQEKAPANFIIVKGNPEKDIRDLHNILWVIKDGKVLKSP